MENEEDRMMSVWWKQTPIKLNSWHPSPFVLFEPDTMLVLSLG